MARISAARKRTNVTIEGVKWGVFNLSLWHWVFRSERTRTWVFATRRGKRIEDDECDWILWERGGFRKRKKPQKSVYLKLVCRRANKLCGVKDVDSHMRFEVG